MVTETYNPVLIDIAHRCVAPIQISCERACQQYVKTRFEWIDTAMYDQVILI